MQGMIKGFLSYLDTAKDNKSVVFSNLSPGENQSPKKMLDKQKKINKKTIFC